MAGVDVVRKNELAKNEELTFGTVYLEIIDFLDSGQDPSHIETLLKTTPNKLKEKYKRFIDKFKEVFKKREDWIAQVLKEKQFRSVKDLVTYRLMVGTAMWADQTLSSIEKTKIALQFSEKATMRTDLPGIYEFVAPKDIIQKIRGKTVGGYVGIYSVGDKRISYSIVSEHGDEKENKGTRIHELQHILWGAREEIITRKKGDFSEFGDVQTQKKAELAFLKFQDELLAYFVETIIIKKDDIVYLMLKWLIGDYADDSSLATTVSNYAWNIKSHLKFDSLMHKSHDDLKVYLYPLMAATDFKDMVQRLKQTKIKYF